MARDDPVELEAVPWSELGPTFIEQWGRSRGRDEAEHVEVTGQTGSGKGYWAAAVLQARAQVRGTSAILVESKPDDDTVAKLGWPIVDDWNGVLDYRWCTYWPRTNAVGAEREKYQAERFTELFTNLWVPNANTVVAVAEIRSLEELSPELRKLIRMYLREARSVGIPFMAMAQRPIGMARDLHSETAWKVVFPPADEDDLDRFAQLLGTPKVWGEILGELDQEKHEFIIKNTVTKEVFVSWVDYEVRPIPVQRDQKPRSESSPYSKKGQRHGRL